MTASRPGIGGPLPSPAAPESALMKFWSCSRKRTAAVILCRSASRTCAMIRTLSFMTSGRDIRFGGFLLFVAAALGGAGVVPSSAQRSEEHTSELQSLMRISYDVFCLEKKNETNRND